MKTYLMSLGVDIWGEIEHGYENTLAIVDKDDKLELSFNFKAMNAILSRLAES